MMATNRIPRELETQENTTRKKAWMRPEVLPSPTPEPGYEFHWVRISTQGQVDATNVSSKLREGWEPCKAENHPEITMVTVENERFAALGEGQLESEFEFYHSVEEYPQFSDLIVKLRDEIALATGLSARHIAFA